MKILLINYMETKSPGGINKVVREIARNISKDNEVIILQRNQYSLPKEEFIDGFKIIRVKCRFSKYFYISPEIYLYIIKNFKIINPDIVHAHGYHTLFSFEVIYLIRKLSSKVPIIFSPHYDLHSHNTLIGKYFWNIHNMIGKRIMKLVDIIIAASDFEAKNIVNDLRVDSKKILLIPHGVDQIDTEKEKKESESIKLLYVGYLLELKGIQHIIKTLYELVYKKNVNAILTIIGEGPYGSNLRTLSKQLGLDNYIKWKGFIDPKNVEDLMHHFKTSDISLLLSKSENYGIVVAESLSMGTPVIVTKTTALKEFINEPGCYGISYPPKINELADLILEIKKNNTKTGPFTSKIRLWDLIIPDYYEAYSDIIKRNL